MVDLLCVVVSTMCCSTTLHRSTCQVVSLRASSTSTTLSRMPDAPTPALHELEAEVMDAVWKLEEATVRDVMDALNEAGSKPRAYTTYMTILGRLHGKGLLARRRE